MNFFYKGILIFLRLFFINNYYFEKFYLKLVVIVYFLDIIIKLNKYFFNVMFFS